MSSNITLSTATSDLSLAGAPLTLRIDARARRLRLRVDRRARGLVLTIPAGLSRRRALAWASGQEVWARDALARVAPPLRLAPGGTLPLFGAPHAIDWSPDRPRTIRREGQTIVCAGPEEQLHGRLVRWLKAQALSLLTEEAKHVAAAIPATLGRVSVGDAGSRWGSCTSRGDIRFSWRLILAPDFVRRYIVAHEVAHLVHMNHGPDFHALADRLFGSDPAPARAWLRRHGASLHAITV